MNVIEINCFLGNFLVSYPTICKRENFNKEKNERIELFRLSFPTIIP